VVKRYALPVLADRQCYRGSDQQKIDNATTVSESGVSVLSVEAYNPMSVRQIYRLYQCQEAF